MNSRPFSLKDVIGSNKVIGIAGHIRPDGDCVGSTLGLYNYLQENYTDLELHIILEPIPNRFAYLKNASLIETAEEVAAKNIDFDAFFTLDCGDGGRLGDAFPFFDQAKTKVCIDHHKSNTAFADFNFIIPDASSTCELVYELISDGEVSKDVAACLYTGMVTDTGMFQYSCTSARTMEVAGILMEKGINYPEIAQKVFFEKSYLQTRVQSYALLKASMHEDNTIASTFITRQEMEEYQVSYKELDGIVSELRNIRGVNVSIFLYENENGSFKASTRCTEGVDLSIIAVKYGGGGHAKAAGFTMYGDSVESMIQEIIQEVKKQL